MSGLGCSRARDGEREDSLRAAEGACRESVAPWLGSHAIAGRAGSIRCRPGTGLSLGAAAGTAPTKLDWAVIEMPRGGGGGAVAVVDVETVGVEVFEVVLQDQQVDLF